MEEGQTSNNISSTVSSGGGHNSFFSPSQSPGALSLVIRNSIAEEAPKIYKMASV